MAKSRKRHRGDHCYYGYIAYDNSDIPRYVGIGTVNRWDHVNSGVSHNITLNKRVACGMIFRIEILRIGTSWSDACEWEITTITNIGRRVTNEGPLYNMTGGGDGGGTNKGRIGTHNPETLECRMIFGTVPDGWVRGYPEERSNYQRTQKMAITNGSSLRFVDIDSGIPPGWYVGGLSHTKGTLWYTNPITYEHRMTAECPEGWLSGRITRQEQQWITDGVNQRKIDKGADIPEGWYIGVIYDGGKGTRWIHNPITGERRRTPDHIPSGWVIGQGVTRYTRPTNFRPRKFYHPETHELILVHTGEQPPEGWLDNHTYRKLVRNHKH